MSDERKGFLSRLPEGLNLEELFARSKVQSDDVSDVAIVGGGLAGLLLALRLSRSGKKNLILVEAESFLGGRLFFSNPLIFPGMTGRERFEVQCYSHASQGGLSGLGFEIMHPDAMESLERHIRNSLSPEEEVLLDGFGSPLSQEAHRRRRCLVVKKQVYALEELLAGSSDLFTKREADLLGFFLSQSNLPEELASVPFEEFPDWKSLGKNPKDALTPLFETLLGDQFLKASSGSVLASLAAFRSWFRKEPTPLALWGAGIEVGLELVLRMRGVKVRTACTVTRITEGEKGYRLLVADEDASLKEINASKVCLAVPLAQCFSFLAREFFSPGQARFASKVRPRSLVALEYQGWQEVCAPGFEDPGPLSRLLFPVERCQAYRAGHEGLIFMSALDYESSLQAPAVRDALSRLRKAASRILDPQIIKLLSQGRRPTTERNVIERLVLVPVGESVPLTGSRLELSQVTMARPGLYLVGDHFTHGQEPWMNVVESVRQAVAELS